MDLLSALPSLMGAAAVVPPLLYLLSITLLDRRREVPYAIIGAFVLAGLATSLLNFIPYSTTSLIEFLLTAQSSDTARIDALPLPAALATLAEALIDIAIPEEAVKVALIIVMSRQFIAYRHPMDGVVFGAAVGLGVAAYENLLLASYMTDEWHAHMIVRSLLTVPVQAALGIIAGLYVARAKYGNTLGAAHGRRSRWRIYGVALLTTVALHSVYNLPLLLARNVYMFSVAEAEALRSVGFVVGTAVILLAALLLFRAAVAEGSSDRRYGPDTLLGYRSWRLDLLGVAAGIAGGLVMLIEIRDLLVGAPFALDRHFWFVAGAGLVAAAVGLHHRSARHRGAAPHHRSTASSADLARKS